MASEGQTGPTGATYHVLLIGIDAYPGRPLEGCVNDIDAVQRVLLDDRLAIPPACIRRLASPLPGTRHETAIAEQPATFANIHAALTELGSERVRPGDRVFLYYSGHGKRVVVKGPDGPTFQREALVPVDFEAAPGFPPGSDAFLFDFELNGLLAAIAARTSSVAVMLDCCHAAGTPRDGGAVRSFDRGARDREPIADPARKLAATRGAGSGDRTGSVHTCQVVSACLANEFSRENERDGVRNGVFTSAFVAAVRGATGDLRTLTWDRIWHAMLNEVMLRHPGQSPRMDGSPRRAVFGGPPGDGDAGLSVSRDGDGYRIAAGTMADITLGTELAIYGPDPARFPPLGSTADVAVRLGVVRVTEADPATARAAAIGPAFELPPGAR
ncbi:MAG TPA: caspase family protein, partial [Kofleriaceae bacterium]